MPRPARCVVAYDCDAPNAAWPVKGHAWLTTGPLWVSGYGLTRNRFEGQVFTTAQAARDARDAYLTGLDPDRRLALQYGGRLSIVDV